MRKLSVSILSAIILLSFAIVPFSISVAGMPQLMVVEWSVDQSENKVIVLAVSESDDGMTNPHYKLLPYTRSTTANYWINPANKFGFTTTAVIKVLGDSANAWDVETSAQVFSYKGTTKKASGKYDGYNVVSFGAYRSGAIAVTYIWSISGKIVETDMRLNTLYKWSLSGESGKMDVQNIATHEFGHWFGLADLYDNADAWLTMYGYGTYGETCKRTLGLGDINGVIKIYGS